MYNTREEQAVMLSRCFSEGLSERCCERVFLSVWWGISPIVTGIILQSTMQI